MSTIDEKRVYGDRHGARTAYVASATGLVGIAISGDTVGEFRLLVHGDVRDVAVGPEILVLATQDDVLLAAGEDVHDGGGPDRIASESAHTDFGTATAVGVDHSGHALAASPDGRLARHVNDWNVLGTVPAPVRGFGRDTVASADGIRPLTNLGESSLSDVRDVADPGPVVATGDGLYRCRRSESSDDTNESIWCRERNGETHRVATLGDRLAAVVKGEVLTMDDQQWGSPIATEAVRDVEGAGGRCYAITDTGVLFVEGDETWRSRSIGVTDGRRLAVA